MARTKIRKAAAGKELLLDTILFAFGVAAVSLLYKNSLLLTLTIIAGWVVALKFWHVKHDIYLFITAAFLATVAEIVAVGFGAWQYSNPTVLGVPIWLPLLWGIAVVFINRVVNTITEKA